MIAQPQINQNYKLFVGADIARTASLVGTLASPSTLASGEIVITDAGNVILDTTSVLTAPQIKIVMGRGATEQLWQSQLFTAADVAAYVGKPYSAKVQQVGYYGYNAVTNAGSFDVINDNYYTVVISFYELLSQEASALMNPIVVEYLSSSTATQTAIVDGLYRQLVTQLSYWSKRPILAERVSSGARTAPGSASTLTFTKGSKTVTGAAATAVDAPVAVGDYISAVTTDLGGMYKVAAISGTTITLDVPFQGDTVTVAATGNLRIASATALAADWGLQITGLNQNFVLDSRPAGLVTFQLGLTNGGSTEIENKAVSPFMGFGTYEIIRTNEAASWRDQGMLYTYTEFPPTTIPTNASSTQNYSVLNVGIKTPTADSQLGMGKLPANLEIACALDNNVASTFDTNYTGALDGSSCIDVLDAYMVNIANLIAQEPNL
jgi:hypothetical protein